MDNVQNCDSYINILSSQTNTSYFSHVVHLAISYIHLPSSLNSFSLLPFASFNAQYSLGRQPLLQANSLILGNYIVYSQLYCLG
jgi:hypothetical protein